MANGKSAKRLGEKCEKSEVVRVTLKIEEWGLVAAMVDAGIMGNRTKASRSAAIESLVMAGLFCLRYHPNYLHDAGRSPEEAKALARALKRRKKRT